MLSLEQLNIINNQLQQENISEFVEQLLMSYSTDEDRISELLALIPKLADRQLKNNQRRIQEYAWATNSLLVERMIYPISQRKSKSKKDTLDFSMLISVCKAHFPDGNCDGKSQASKEFFDEFIEAIKNKIGFDYENKEDWDWICNTLHFRNWMLHIIKQYVDSEFVEPKVYIKEW